MNRMLEIPTEMTIEINRDFTSIHDLSWTLIDLQALVTGFLYGLDDILTDESYNYVVAAEDIHEQSKTDAIIERIENIIELDDYRKKRMTHEIDEVLDTGIYIDKKESTTVRRYQSARRSITNRYKDVFKLRSFKQGSLLLGVTTTVLGGLLLEFFRRLFYNEIHRDNSIQINLYDQKIIVYNNGSVRVISDEQFDNISLNNNNEVTKKLSTTSYINSVLDKVSIDNSNVSKSVHSLLSVMIDEKLVRENIIYNQKAIKTISADLTRLKGSIIDYKG